MGSMRDPEYGRPTASHTEWAKTGPDVGARPAYGEYADLVQAVATVNRGSPMHKSSSTAASSPATVESINKCVVMVVVVVV